MQHPLYIVNMPERKERLESVLSQFAHRPEFNVCVVQPETDTNPRKSLWRTLCKLIANEISDRDFSYFIFCEDDHVSADKDILFES